MRRDEARGRPLDPRPDLTPAIERVITRLCALPALRGLDARRILVVAQGAHGGAAASVRALHGQMKRCHIDGERRLVELCLRPQFFLDGDAPRRLTTLAHELLHLDPAKPGALRDDNRHARRSHASLDREARALARELLTTIDPVELLCLAHDGELLMRQWAVRPAESTRARAFTDKDVFLGPLRMHTPEHARGGWW